MPTANVVQSKALYELGHVDVPRLIWKNFMPAFVGVVVSALYNIVDRIFIGQEVGPFALAGLSAVFPIMLLQQAFAMLIGLGSSVGYPCRWESIIPVGRSGFLGRRLRFP